MIHPPLDLSASPTAPAAAIALDIRAGSVEFPTILERVGPKRASENPGSREILESASVDVSFQQTMPDALDVSEPAFDKGGITLPGYGMSLPPADAKRPDVTVHVNVKATGSVREAPATGLRPDSRPVETVSWTDPSHKPDAVRSTVTPSPVDPSTAPIAATAQAPRGYLSESGLRTFVAEPEEEPRRPGSVRDTSHASASFATGPEARPSDAPAPDPEVTGRIARVRPAVSHVAPASRLVRVALTDDHTIGVPGYSGAQHGSRNETASNSPSQSDLARIPVVRPEVGSERSRPPVVKPAVTASLPATLPAPQRQTGHKSEHPVAQPGTGAARSREFPLNAPRPPVDSRMPAGAEPPRRSVAPTSQTERERPTHRSIPHQALEVAQAQRQPDGVAEPDPDPVRQPVQQSATAATPTAPAPNTMAPVQLPASGPVPVPTSPPLASQPETMARAESASPIESTIDQLAEARETGRKARPQLTVRHHEFGPVRMQIEASGADLRAVIANRDPAFAPAVHAALGERTIAAAGETANQPSARGSDHPGQSSGSGNQAAGQGGSSEGRYGSSTGSGQASSQPYREQNGAREDEFDRSGAQDPAKPGLPDARGGDVFA